MDPITTIIGLATTIMNKIWGNKDDELKRQFLVQMQAELAMTDLAKKQIDVNIEEAKNTSIFVAGGRPFIIWVCGFSFAWQFVIQPFFTYFVVLAGYPAPILPVLDYVQLNTMLAGLLGLGAMRSYEKIKGV